MDDIDCYIMRISLEHMLHHEGCIGKIVLNSFFSTCTWPHIARKIHAFLLNTAGIPSSLVGLFVMENLK